MPYCTQDDLLKLIPARELAQISAETGDTLDAAVVAAAIARADREIDSYLAVRYQVPVVPTPERLRDLSVDLAIYWLCQRRSTVPEGRRQAYEDGVNFLKLVGKGQAQIPDAAGVEIPADAEEVTEITSSTRVFSRDTMSGY